MTKRSTLLLLAFTFFTFCLFAQQARLPSEVLRRATLSEWPRTGLEPRLEMDTLAPPAFGDECALNQEAFGITDRWGAVGGMNEFGDFEKAQLINNTTNTEITITEGLVFFNRAIVVGNGNLRMKVYSVGSTDGKPDVLLGQSDDITADQIAIDEEFIVTTTFPFSTPVTLADDSFILSVDLSDLYATEDTTDLLHTEIGCGSGDEAFELWNDGAWNTMREVWSSEGSDFDINFSIFAVIEFEAPNAVDDPYFQSGAIRLRPAAPNPARQQVRLNYELEKAGPVRIEIFAADGRRLQNRQLGLLPAGPQQEDVNLSDFAQGAYIYSIVTETARVTSRFIVE